ncbi:MAG: thiamine-phosphate kinase [Myxococcota bacterium]
MYREFELIERIATLFDQPEGVTFGIGDDCAVLDPGRFDLITTDTLVEGTHFRREWSSAHDIGWKALAVSLSDVAAMGGGPGAFLLNLTLSEDVDEAWIDELLAGIKAACGELIPEGFHVSVGGGDVTSTTGPTVITTTLLGEASPAGPVLRNGAVPGDRLILLGPTGASAAGLAILRGDFDVDPESFPGLLTAHRRPNPRIREGALLGLYGIPSSLIDISDGLARDLGHILDSSSVGATIETHSLPRHPELITLGEAVDIDLLELMLTGGDDYELLISVPPARMPKLWEVARREEWDVYDIGEVRAPEEGMRILGPDGKQMDFDSLGFEHFE